MASVIAYTALSSPPNSVDALSYHLPRIVQWVQNRSIAFFPTSYLNQIMLGPVAEYLMLHTWLMSGGDRLVNLVQFGGYAGSVVGVSSIAQALGLQASTQAIAALFCATLPNAILQASGAKNDALLSFWLVAMALFVLRWVEYRSRIDAVFLGLAAGLALGTKGTAWLFAPPFLVAALLAAGGLRRIGRREWVFAASCSAAGVLLINGPQYARNLDLSGSILGFDSAQADGFFRWRNETFGWGPTVSNIVRNTSEQLGARSEAWNRLVYSGAIRLHDVLGLDPQDPRTTWRWEEFKPPRNTNHEASANNRWHLLIIVIGMAVAVYRAAAYRETRWVAWSLAPAGGFLAFCFYLKWQPFFARLELPLFVISAPLAAVMVARLLPFVLQVAVCALLVSNCRLALTENWTRPLEGARNLRNTPRQSNYFNDMVQWNNRESYVEAVARTGATGCRLVGIDLTRNHVVYPFEALLREKDPLVRFVEVGVQNSSRKYARADAARPCAVLCLDCAGDDRKVALHSPTGDPITIGRFLLFLNRD